MLRFWRNFRGHLLKHVEQHWWQVIINLLYTMVESWAGHTVFLQDLCALEEPVTPWSQWALCRLEPLQAYLASFQPLPWEAVNRSNNATTFVLFRYHARSREAMMIVFDQKQHNDQLFPTARKKPNCCRLCQSSRLIVFHDHGQRAPNWHVAKLC